MIPDIKSHNNQHEPLRKCGHSREDIELLKMELENESKGRLVFSHAF